MQSNLPMHMVKPCPMAKFGYKRDCPISSEVQIVRHIYCFNTSLSWKTTRSFIGKRTKTNGKT